MKKRAVHFVEKTRNCDYTECSNYSQIK